MNSLVTCKTPRCGAKFDPSLQWYYGWRDPDSTTDDFNSSGKIQLGNCPVCRRPQTPSTEQAGKANG